MVRRRILLLFAVVVIVATVVISVIASQFLLQSGTDAKGGSVEMSDANIFSKNLVLRGTASSTPLHPYVRHMLLDKDTIYPNPSFKEREYGYNAATYDRYDYDICAHWLSTTKGTIYNRSFVYTKPALKEYYILGMASVSLTFNLSCDTSGEGRYFELWFNVSLYRLASGVWDEVIDFGTENWTVLVGAPTFKKEFQSGLWFSYSVGQPIWVGPQEKIALRITVSGRTSYVGGLYIDLYHCYEMTKPNQFVVDLPIVEP